MQTDAGERPRNDQVSPISSIRQYAGTRPFTSFTPVTINGRKWTVRVPLSKQPAPRQILFHDLNSRIRNCKVKSDNSQMPGTIIPHESITRDIPVQAIEPQARASGPRRRQVHDNSPAHGGDAYAVGKKSASIRQEIHWPRQRKRKSIGADGSRTVGADLSTGFSGRYGSGGEGVPTVDVDSSTHADPSVCGKAFGVAVSWRAARGRAHGDTPHRAAIMPVPPGN